MNSKLSIDLWGTLIKSSPIFHLERAKLSKKYTGAEIEVSEKIFHKSKTCLDILIEKSGWQPTKEMIWGYLSSHFPVLRSNPETVEEFYKDYQKLVLKHHPLLWDSDVIDSLKRLSNRYTLILSSNTLFVSGETLRNVLDILDISKYFTLTYFSDQIGLAKPNKVMYGSSHFHIGDNPVTDGVGAVNAGCLQYFIINRNQVTLQDITNKLTPMV